MEKVIVICGPTASGKTALSIELAKKNQWRNNISRLNANIQRYEHWNSKTYSRRNARNKTLPFRFCFSR